MARSINLEKSELEQFVDEVTAGIRAYLEAKKEIHFLEMTTKEVSRALKKENFDKETSESIISLLKLGDRFKFADETLQQNEFKVMIDKFTSLVDTIEAVERKNETSKS